MPIMLAWAGYETGGARFRQAVEHSPMWLKAIQALRRQLEAGQRGDEAARREAYLDLNDARFEIVDANFEKGVLRVNEIVSLNRWTGVSTITEGSINADPIYINHFVEFASEATVLCPDHGAAGGKNVRITVGTPPKGMKVSHVTADGARAGVDSNLLEQGWSRKQHALQARKHLSTKRCQSRRCSLKYCWTGPPAWIEVHCNLPPGSRQDWIPQVTQQKLRGMYRHGEGLEEGVVERKYELIGIMRYTENP